MKKKCLFRSKYVEVEVSLLLANYADEKEEAQTQLSLKKLFLMMLLYQ